MKWSSLICLFFVQMTQHADTDTKFNWHRDLEAEWIPCLTALLMPYDSAGSLCQESTLPDFPLCGFKIVRTEKEFQSHLETAIDLRELLGNMHESVYAQDNNWSLNDSCHNEKHCIADLIYNYGSQHIQDFNEDNKINCDDLGILLYTQNNLNIPTTIECTTFWKLYRRNAAFLKHSQHIDINDNSLFKEKVPKKNMSNGTIKVKRTDKDFFTCKNGDCGSQYKGGFITKCDGILQCVDMSDEQHCETCEGSSLKCLVNNVETCLPYNDLCKFNPTICKHINGSLDDLQQCKHKSFHEKLEHCKNFLDEDDRKTYGEYVYMDEGGSEIHTPKRAYRNRLCRLNGKNVFGTDNKTTQDDMTDDYLPDNYHEFHYININQSLCQDQIDQRLGACKDSCPQYGELGEIEFWKCNNGRCIDLYAVCEGVQNCKDGEDESVQACAQVGYETCPFNTFPCPISGKCISEHLVCNGVKDCPDDEDEDFYLWTTGSNTFMHIPYLDQAKKWAQSNPHTNCHQFGIRGCQLNMIFLIIILVLVATIVALSLKPVEAEKGFLNSVKTILHSDVKKEENVIDLLDIRRGPLSEETASTIDFLLLKNEFENMTKLETSKEVKNKIAGRLFESESCDQKRGLMKVKTMNSQYSILLKDHMFQSFSLKTKNSLHKKMSKKGEISDAWMTVFKLGKSVLPLYIVGAIALEYYFDLSLVMTWTRAYKETNTSGFSFAPYFLGIAVLSCLTLAVSYLAMVFIGFYKTYFKVEDLPQKIFHMLSLILIPFSFPIARFIFNLKKEWQPAANIEDYLDQEIISLQYEVILNQMAVVKTLLENMPQLFVGFLLSLSAPLYEKIEKYEYKAIVFMFVYVKPIFTVISKSWQISKLHKNLRDQKIGLIGNSLVCLFIFFCTMSRILAITFCIIFSSCFPDIPYYLYELSNAGVFQDEITPYAREILYMADISPAPAIFVICMVVINPFIYYMLAKYYLLRRTKNIPCLKVQLLLAMTNIFCPLKPRLDFDSEINDKHNILINGTIFFLFFITNVLYLVFPLFWYGASFFTTTLPVLDELIRFFRFKNLFGHFPLSFPTQMPTFILKGHTIFPVCSLLCFVIGSLLFILYQKKFHLWAAVKPTDLMKYKSESTSEMNKTNDADQLENERILLEFKNVEVLESTESTIYEESSQSFRTRTVTKNDLENRKQSPKPIRNKINDFMPRTNSTSCTEQRREISLLAGDNSKPKSDS